MDASISPFVDVDLPLGDRRDGKVRVSYDLGDGHRLMVTTDRLSAFDRVIAGVPFKGQVLNELSAWWFEQLDQVLADHGVGHHLVSVPDPNVMVVREVVPLPVEVVVRGHITGVTDTSLWQRYHDGARTIYGYTFPDGLEKNTALPSPIITPTTKAAAGGHDEPITCADVVAHGLVDAAVWDQVMSAALAAFARGVEVGRAAGVVLADTKYEFGVTPQGDVLLVDEVHTPDSSRWWVAASLEERRAAGSEPESLDKEVVRRAFADLGYRGDGAVPALGDEVWSATTARYVDAYQRLTRRTFLPGTYPVQERIIGHLTKAGLL